MTLSLGHIFVYETLGTALLLLLGCGVVATAILRNSKGDGGGWLLINFGWGIGVFVGAVLCWLAFREHFDAEEDPGKKLAVFSTGPAMRSPIWNVVTEVIATFVLIFWILISGGTPTAVGPLAVALVVVGIGASLGGPTGYAINPARDLAPRIAHAILPIKGKGPSDWSYSWVPVVAPVIGAVLATLAFKATDAADLIAEITAK